VRTDETSGNGTEPSDEEVLDSFLQGRRESFAVLVKRYEHRITAFLYRVVGNYQRAEELCQETFMRVFRSASSFNPKYRFSTWLYTIGRNLAANELRDRARSVRGFSIRVQDWPEEGKIRDVRHTSAENPHTIAVTSELREKLAEAMGTLQHNYRMALVLKEFQGMTYNEVAQVFETSPGTVKSWVYRAKKELAVKLKALHAF